MTSHAVQPAQGSPLSRLLQRLGFDTDTELVYRTLLEQPSLTPEDLAARLGLVQETVHKALTDLSDKALLSQMPEASHRWLPADPELRLGGLLAAEEVEITRRWQAAQQARRYIAKLAATYKDAGFAESVPDVEHVADPEDVRKRMAAFLGGSSVEVAVMETGMALSTDTPVAPQPLLAEALHRGVRVRAVYVESIRNSLAAVEEVREIVRTGAEVLTVPSIPFELVAVDRSLAVIPFEMDDPCGGALVVSNPSLVRVCYELYERVWEDASPLAGPSRRRAAPGAEPTAQERELLRLLAMGYPDEVAARQLCVSLRTVRRMMAGLMRRMGAKSRFQAGVKATALQWTQPAGAREVTDS
ncbi:helix-turn-helix transcriptional regulator [Streptomyces naphthomycinicus]|uniref:helix-turn-helix transcriptional regulator n=1 Tax=Streptomyces naphthomycinicus TaxID=2872625 RepID=UPI001CED56BA|nr:LuxR family transcriptional regulator [Streptomyces sp. TML10]